MSLEANCMISLANLFGNPYIGVYCSASEKYAILLKNAEKTLVEPIRESLSVEVIETNISGSTIVGSLVAMNSNGIILSNFATEDELSLLPDDLEVAVMEEKYNAAGNNILVNDRAALVNPGVSDESLRVISDTFGVEAVRGTIAGITTVGSVALANGKGVLCHPRASEDDVEHLRSLFSGQVTLATLNYGIPWLGACAVANNNGCVVGEKTTPIELGKLEDGLGYL